ncbi:hypothetical protein G7046_g8404 [Stylonectria norvegica]|nr:hypothetical protein G7046_g8404 [Stylonectria norvegica]
MKHSQAPQITRFLSDFTLGFSDGLTVPFALTAGLSSLGSTNTVILGGLAELCAGCLSMGIGGYLSARDMLPESKQLGCQVQDEEERGILNFDGDESVSGVELDDKFSSEAEKVLRKHLTSLDLPESVTSTILTTLQNKPDSLIRVATNLQEIQYGLSSSTLESSHVSPVVSGCCISLGYAIGGIIPLFPYFFAHTVGAGFRWSLCLCVFALFAFGSGKSRLLRGTGSLSHCFWEGVNMLVLGMIAAGATVACVTFMEWKMG